MENEINFESFYNNQLESQLYDLECERKKVLNKTLITLFAFAFILLILVVISLLTNLLFLLNIGLITFIILLILFFQFKRKYATMYTKLYKQKIIKLLLGYFKQDLQLFPEEKLPEETFKKSLLFGEYNSYWGEDLIMGNVDGIPVSISDLCLQFRSGKSSNIVFKGVAAIIQMPRSYNTNTIILPDSAEKFFGEKIGNFFQYMGESNGKLVKIDNPEFENEFVVYSSNPENTRSLLNNKLAENILNMKKTADSNMYFSFIDNMVFVALKLNYMFEPRIFKTLKDVKYMNQQAEYLRFFINMVKLLNVGGN